MKFHMSEQTKIEAQIGFLIGIIIGALAAGVVTIVLTPWAWYLKVFTSIGTIGILGSLGLSLNETLKARRNFLDTMKEMEGMQAEAKKVIEESMNVPLDTKPSNSVDKEAKLKSSPDNGTKLGEPKKLSKRKIL